ncbi:MAG TPA: nitrilase-related carbon-nitrogen hydrolase [Bryobacteraceae bacterium]|nr:nitrilase-related carbon-nitrogen hydrolase [Bryobacteraceae bacterium]
MKIALAQTNTTVGDLCGNGQRILSFARRAAESGAGAVVFPELTLTGYPPRDLLEKQSFLDRAEEHLQQLAAEAANLDVTIICGAVTRSGISSGHPIYNSAAVLEGGRIAFRQHKMLLPTYDVFDEARYFEPAPKQGPLKLGASIAALTICEDAWNDKQYWERPLYSRDPVEELAASGARILISLNASPYHMGKRRQRHEIFAATARHFRMPIVYVNQVGGNDHLIFDGSSFAMDADGRVVACAASFEEDLVLFDTETLTGDRHENYPEECEAVYQALVLGTRDYIRKCGFERVIVGLSGGIDSALTAAIATGAVGKENVVGVGMPGPYSSEHSVADARGLAVISDVPKTMVYSLARVANRRHAGAIPENTFVKPPSAELRPDQKDSDSLPDYAVLDQILEGYVENNASSQQIADSLHLSVTLVRDIVNKVDRNEYKRQQAAPGLKVTTKAFGVGRRFPIAQRFSE